MFLLAGAGVAVAAAGRREAWLLRRGLVRAHIVATPANLLRNADFSACTNPPVPDYWGTDATAQLGDLHDALTIDPSVVVFGRQSLRLRNIVDGELALQAHPTFVPQPIPYTLSAYVRSDHENRQVRLRLGWGGGTSFAVGREWNRVQVTYEPRLESTRRHGLEARVSVVGQGTVWISLPQLEPGTTPTAFSTALIDDHPLPQLPWDADEEWTPPALAGGRSALAIDGQPKVVTTIAIESPTREALKDVASHGFDAISLFVPAAGASGEFDRDTEEVLPWLDEASRNHLLVLPFLTHRQTGSVRELTMSVVRTIGKLKSHPSILAWIVLDEPSRLWPSPPWTELAALRAVTRAEDPDRPVIINDNACRDGGAGLLSASDVGSLDIYPVGQYENSLKPVADLSMKLNQACAASKKPAAMWLQMYGYDDAVREPTPEEERAMTYSTFIHGTRLLCYWIYKPMSSRLWASMKAVRSELARLEQVVLADDARCLKIGVQSGRVHYAWWLTGTRAYLMACNISPTTVFTSFGLEVVVPRRALNGWYDDGHHLRIGDHLWAILPPFGRQVWELAG